MQMLLTTEGPAAGLAPVPLASQVLEAEPGGIHDLPAKDSLLAEPLALLSWWQISWLSYGPGRHPGPLLKDVSWHYHGLQQTSAQNRARGLHHRGNDMGRCQADGALVHVWQMLLYSHLIPASSFPRTPYKNISKEQKGKVGEEGTGSKGNSSQQHQENQVGLRPPWMPQENFPPSSYMFSFENKHPS